MRAPDMEQAIGVVSNKAPACYPISPEKHKWLKMFCFVGSTRKLSGIGRKRLPHLNEQSPNGWRCRNGAGG